MKVSLIMSHGLEGLQSHIRKIDEQISEPKVFILNFILKCFTAGFDIFVTICMFSKIERNLDGFKRGLGIFEYDKRRRSNVERPKSTFFRNNRRTPK